MKNSLIILGIILLLTSTLMFAEYVEFVEDDNRTSGHVYGDVYVWNPEFGRWDASTGETIKCDIWGSWYGHVYRFPVSSNGWYDASFIGDPAAMHEDSIHLKVTFRGQSYTATWDYDEGVRVDIYFYPDRD